MRKKAASRHHSQKEHSSYGIYKWFALRGIKDTEIMMQTMAEFCSENGFEITKQTKEEAMINFIQTKIQRFFPFAGNFLKENNYITT